MIFNKHPQATTVTLLIAAERSPQGLEEDAHVVLAEYFAHWPDEMKADLYARLAECLKPSMTIGQMELLVSRCLWDNQNVFFE